MDESQPDITKPKRSFLVWLLSWKVLLPTFILMAVIITPLIIRQYHLAQIPPIEEPFNLKKYGTVAITDAENGYVEYKLAVSKLVLMPKLPTAKTEKLFYEENWGEVIPEARKWLVDNQEALMIWKRGTEKPKYLVVQPLDLSAKIPIEVQMEEVRIARTFMRLAILNILQLKSEGKQAESAIWIRALYRFGCQYGQNNVFLYRLIGQTFRIKAMSQYLDWLENPAVTHKMIKQALLNLKVDAIIIPSISETIRSEYYSILHYDDLAMEYKKDHWEENNRTTKTNRYIWELEYFMEGEPEKNVRLIKHAIANWLPDCDKPRHMRPTRTPRLYFFDTSSSLIPAHDLESIIYRSTYSAQPIDRLATIFDIQEESLTKNRILKIILAAHIYQRKHGHFPASTAELLAEGDLKKMPLDATKPIKTEITYRHSKGFTVVYIVREGFADDGGLNAELYHPGPNLGYILEGKKKSSP